MAYIIPIWRYDHTLLCREAEALSWAVSRRAAAQSIARTNQALGNPLNRRETAAGTLQRRDQLEASERRFHQVLDLLVAAGLAPSAHRINAECAVRFQTIEQRRYAELMKAVGEKDLGHDQAPGLAYHGGLAPCHHDSGRTGGAPHGKHPSGPPRISTPDFVQDAATPYAPATSRSTANA